MAATRRLPETLLEVADDLARLDAGGAPRQASLRRAASTGYYAMFHFMLQACTELMLRNAAQWEKFAGSPLVASPIPAYVIWLRRPSNRPVDDALRSPPSSVRIR